MALKIIEAHVPESAADEALALAEEVAARSWREEGGRFGAVVHAIVGAERSGSLVDALQERVGERGSIMVLVELIDFAHSVLASLFNSCIRKSSRRPQVPPACKIRLLSCRWLSKRSSSSSTSAFWAA